MAKYTTQVRTICEVNGGYDESQGFDNVEEVINKAIPNIFNFDFPIYDPSYKNVLCHKILLEYYTREIAFETVGLWKLKLRAKLNKIMPYYNQLYKSELLEFNPFYDVDLEKTYNKRGDESNFSDSATNSNNNETFNSTNELTERLTGNKGSNTDYGEIVKSDGTSKGTSTDDVKNTTTKVNDGTTVVEYDSAKDDTSKNDKINKVSDTPQSTVTNIKDGKYLTSAQVDEINQTNKSVVKDKTKNVATIIDDETFESKGIASTNSTTTNNNDIKGNSDTVENYTDNKTGSNLMTNYGSKYLHSTTQNNASIQSLEDYIERVQGKNGGKSYSELLNEFRNTMLNIDSMVLDELSDLFFNLW